jgi:hypothetical protein
VATSEATRSNDYGTATFQLFAARFTGCAVRLPLTASLRMLPICAVFEAGSLRAAGGGGIKNPQRTTMPWLGLGAALRAQWDLLPRLAVEASGSAVGLLRQDTFTFLPDTLVYEVPGLSLGARLGISLRLH